MNKLRKSLIIGVMMLTVLMTSGINVDAAAPQAGDLIKMDGLSTVYFLGNDGKRYVYPHSSVFFTWHKDFSGVVTVSPSELASYPLGSNVVMKAGTKLVKITTDPSVYAVEPNGVLRKISSEADAIALYGSMWAKRVVDVADSFFTNYTVGTPLTSGQIPAGSLVKNANSAAVYYFDGTNYRSIASETAFNANRFDFANVLTITNAITAGGNSVTTAEFAYDAQGGSQGTVVTGSGLTASLSAATPAGISVPKNGARVPMAKVNLTAANDGAITVSSITVKRIGLSTYSNIDKVWAEKDGVMVASKKSMNSNDESILTFSPALTVNAGQTVTLELIAALTGDNAGTIGLSIASASAVSASAASISGSFPINGNLMSPTNYTVTDVTISGANTATSTVKVGDEKVELGKFELAVTKDVTVKSIMLKNNGVEDLAKASMNLYIEQAGNKVSTSYTVDGRYVTFNLNNLEILKDDASKIFYVKGDVIAKENTAANSFSFVLNKSTDLVATEKATGFGANVVTAPSTAADAYAISNLTIDAGAVSVSKKSTSPSDTTIVKGTDNTVLLANVRTDESITADGLKISYTQSTTSPQYENARVYVNGVLLDSFDLAATTTPYVVVKSIDSTFTLNKGDNLVEVKVKAKTTAIAGTTIKFTLSGDTMFTGMNPEYVVSGNAVSGTMSGTATGATFTVQGASLQTVRNDGYATGKIIVRGSSDISLGKFTVKATNDEVKITSIQLSANASTTPVAATSISDMKLFVDGTQVGNIVDFGSTGANFSSLNFTIAKDSTKNIEIKGAFDTSAAGGFQTLMTVNSQDSRGTSIVSGHTASTTMFNVVEQGSLNVELGGNTPAAAILAAKSVEQEVAQFKFTAVNDDASLTELNVVNTIISTTSISSTTTAVADADSRIAAIKLYDGATLIDSFVPVSGAGKFTITNDKVKVLANQSKTLSIKVVLNNIDNDAAATGKDIHLGLTTLKFKSSNGTENTQGANGANGILANNFRIRKTVPTVALMALPTTVLTAGDQVISKFTVTADANGDVTLDKIVLTATTSALATITKLTVNDSIKVNGAYKTASSTLDYTGGLFTVQFLNPEVISAGTTKTFEILANLAVSGANTESVTTKIVEDGSYGTTGNFIWSDGASVTSYTYSNGYRVPGLTTATQVLSK
ncbi:MAG: hypothetical protein WAW11_05270 [Patescibacteria group bacterium]